MVGGLDADTASRSVRTPGCGAGVAAQRAGAGDAPFDRTVRPWAPGAPPRHRRAAQGVARPSALVVRGAHAIPLRRPKRAERGFVAFQMPALPRPGPCPTRHAPVQPGAAFADRRWRQIANPDQMAPRCAQMSCTVAGAHCIERSAGCEPSEAHAVSAAASFSPISPGYSLAWLDCLRNSAAVCIMARLFRKKMLQRAAMNEVFV